MAYKQRSEPFGSRPTAASREFHKQGYTWQTRLWIDDMFMITAMQSQAFRATGNRAYVDRAAREMVLIWTASSNRTGCFTTRRASLISGDGATAGWLPE